MANQHYYIAPDRRIKHKAKIEIEIEVTEISNYEHIDPVTRIGDCFDKAVETIMGEIGNFDGKTMEGNSVDYFKANVAVSYTPAPRLRIKGESVYKIAWSDRGNFVIFGRFKSVKKFKSVLKECGIIPDPSAIVISNSMDDHAIIDKHGLGSSLCKMDLRTGIVTKL